MASLNLLKLNNVYTEQPSPFNYDLNDRVGSND